MQVAGAGEHRAGVALCRGQHAFIEPARLDRTSARRPHVRHHDGRAQLVRDHAGRVQAGDRLGERAHRGTEVAGGPAAKPTNPAAAPRGKWCSGPARASARRHAETVPSMSPRACATEAGRPRSWPAGADLSLLVPDRSAQRAPAERPMAASSRDQPRRRPATPPPRRFALEEPLHPTQVASSGRRRTTSPGSAASETVAKRPVLASLAQIGQGELDEAAARSCRRSRSRAARHRPAARSRRAIGWPKRGPTDPVTMCQTARRARNASAKRWW